jgi:hypothetical protein
MTVNMTRSLSPNDVEDDDTVDLYMKALVGRVSTSSLGNLYSARSEYSQVSTGDDNFENAQFNNVVIVNSLIVLSNIKGVLDPEGDGISDCDINSNDTPDEADAAACALLVVGGESCSQIDANEGTPTSGLSFEGFTNTYNGYQVLITDNGGPDEGGACPSTYKKLLNSTDTSVVATTSDQCVDVSGNGTWPCPFEDGGNSVDIVSAFQDAVVTSSDFLDEMIEDVDNEISEAVDELLVEVCGADEQCTSTDMAQYLDELD